eukprot:TRINITY_DN19113_c0_g1_i1.p1 TRINITY_DN19113_c0_g1~~TRINITY_DN19113_c0_g1_i1.p1  ORF type:complete len:430 (+),score=51.04 TRINITY_DN19113_c0_g1_i1:58-1290(+)
MGEGSERDQEESDNPIPEKKKKMRRSASDMPEKKQSDRESDVENYNKDKGVRTPPLLASAAAAAVPPQTKRPVKSSRATRSKGVHSWGSEGVTPLIDKPDVTRVTCVACLADQFEMETIKRILLNHFPEAATTECAADTSVINSRIPLTSLRSRQTARDWGLDIELFIFEHGAVAYWGVNEQPIWDTIVATLRPGYIQPVLDYDCELCTFSYTKTTDYPMTTSASESDYHSAHSDNIRYSWLDQDHFYLASTDADVKLAYSFAIAQSEKLSYYEDKISTQINTTRRYPEELAEKGHVGLSGREIARTKGKLFLHRMNIILHTDLLDTPDYFWERTDLEPLYVHSRKYFEISRRVRVLNTRLEVVAELFDMLHDQQKQKHSDRLEWIVIWLIIVEVIVAAFSIYLKITGLK